MNSLPTQNWNPERYSENARFVSNLGAPVVDQLVPQHKKEFSILDVVVAPFQKSSLKRDET
ncbi:hypothetical protein [Nitrospira sp. Ecomares 2.1]